MKDRVALIVAGGKGSRMGAKVSKQFIEIREKPILYYTLKKFEESKSIDYIVLVLPEEEILQCKNNIIMKYGFKKVKTIVAGGRERQDSVYNGLKAIGQCEVVLIHDGARPFIDEDIIEKGITYALEHGGCACGVLPKDTIKVKDEEGMSKHTLNRNELFCVQTPQVFRYEIIIKAHESIRRDNKSVTDDTMAAEYIGEKVFLYQGSYKNIKITTPEDLAFAEILLNN